MQCVILAGGLATRLYPMTRTIPKSLIPINGRPFVEYQLSRLAAEGISEVVLCIGFLGQQIRDAVGPGNRFGLKIEYWDEGDNLKGTGGALRIAHDAGLLREAFYVLYGDSFLPVSYAPVMDCYRSAGRKALMTVMRNEN